MFVESAENGVVKCGLLVWKGDWLGLFGNTCRCARVKMGHFDSLRSLRKGRFDSLRSLRTGGFDPLRSLRTRG